MVKFSALEEKKQFSQLQSQLSKKWQDLASFYGSQLNLIVVPSMTLEQKLSKNLDWLNHYEERLLFSLTHLKNPNSQLTYLTSQPLPPNLIDYYLELLPGISATESRSRLTLLSTYDVSGKSLSQKILERPHLIQRLRQKVSAVQSSCMICFSSTPLEKTLSVQLGIPLFALDPDLEYWGTKAGSRQIFQECDVPHPDGSTLIKNKIDLALAVNDLRNTQPQLPKLIIKLNQGFSGYGNAILDLTSSNRAELEKSTKDIDLLFSNLRFQSPTENWTTFKSKLTEQGAIVESFVEGKVKHSPSVQGCIMPNGEVEILSTHEQFLGGLDGMTYLGCRFPADDTYRLQLQELGKRVGENLAAKGALECFNVDFLAVEQTSGAGVSKWELQAIEINLRKSGTTHPFMFLKNLTNGRYDISSGLFYSQSEVAKYYVASDNLKKPQYQGLLPEDLRDIITQHKLNFDKTTETGTIFHLTTTLSEFGKLGVTCIGDSPASAKAIYDNVVRVLDEETKLEKLSFE